MTTSQPQFASREDLIRNIVEKVLDTGFHSDKRHSLELSPGYVIWVKERASGKGVAYSSAKADFEQSLIEFVTDYFA